MQQLFLTTDHPHARGENVSHTSRASALAGPSPRAWGEPSQNIEVLKRTRTIPTRVGRTKWCEMPRYPPPDHPHARGENGGSRHTIHLTAGPSPRAWGEPATARSRPGFRRTIPTRVGRTNSIPPSSPPAPDHPHARGENLMPSFRKSQTSGPSPRAWGERPSEGQDKDNRRTIPTRVGRTHPLASMVSEAPDHPHARGENAVG